MSAPIRINLPSGDSAFSDTTYSILVAKVAGSTEILLVTALHLIVDEETAVYFGDALDPAENTVGDLEVFYGPYSFAGKGQGMVLPHNPEGHFRFLMSKGLRIWTLTDAGVHGTMNVARLAK